MSNSLISVLLLALLVGGIFLQIFLSKSAWKWPGLILPGMTVLFSLVMMLNFVALPGMTTGELFAQMAVLFIMGNLPTFVLLGIYFACREKRRARDQLDKMNIQDLE